MAGESLKLKMLIEAVNQSQKALASTQKDLKKIQDQLGKTNKASQKTTETFKKAGAVMAAAGALAVGALKSWLDASIKQERAEKRLDTLLGNVTGTTKENIKALKDQAAALQQVGVVGDEVAIVGQSQLATFALQSKTIEELTPAMLDLVVATKGVNATQEDMINVGNLVGKVMQGQVGALSRVGVSFNEAQSEILKTGTEMERAATLSKILEENFGGLNEAMRMTTEGQLAALKNSFGDFKEQLGAQLAPVIGIIAEKLQIVTNVLANLSPGTQKIIVGITAAIAVFGLLGGAIAAIIVAGPALMAAFTLMIGPIGAVGVAIAGLALVWNENLGGIQEKTKSAFDAVKESFNSLKEESSKIWDKIVEKTGLSTAEMKAIGGAFLEGFKDLFKVAFDFIAMIVSTVFDAIKIVIETTLKVLGGIIDVGLNLIDANWGAAWASFKGIFVDIWDGMVGFLEGSVNAMISGINKIIDAINKLPGVAIPNLNKIGAAADKAASKSISAVNLAQKAVAGQQGAESADLPAKQFGGFAKANQPIKVGEAGTEIFTPTTAGTITPNNQLGGNIQVGNMIGTVIVQNEADEDRLIEKLKFAFSRDMQLQKLASQS